MLGITFSYMRHHLFRFAMSIFGVALLITLVLMLDALINSFYVSSTEYPLGLKADTYIIQSGSIGPFYGSSSVPDSLKSKLKQIKGVKEITPLIFASANTKLKNSNPFGLSLSGFKKGSAQEPKVYSGHLPRQGRPEVTMDTSKYKVKIGDTLKIFGQKLKVVGLTKNYKFGFGGPPIAFTSIKTAQKLVYQSAPMVSLFLVTKKQGANLNSIRQNIEKDFSGLSALTKSGLRKLILSVWVDPSIGQIRFFQGITFVTSIAIMAIIMYVSIVDRIRDIGIYRAIGGKSYMVALGLMFQAIVLVTIGSALGSILAGYAAINSPIGAAVNNSSYIFIGISFILVSIFSTAITMTKALKIDPIIVLKEA
jgi:putative ABC transport system permease protein